MEESFLCSYDDKGYIKNFYNICSAILRRYEDGKLIVYIKDSDLPSGDWKFFGSVKHDHNDDWEYVTSSGNKSGNHSGIDVDRDILCPPVCNCITNDESSWTIKKERLNICQECPFFNKKKIKCDKNGDFILKKISHSTQSCPEKRWESDNDELDNSKDNTNQEDFELELEEYLKGI